jgi:hypothetical protein
VQISLNYNQLSDLGYAFRNSWLAKEAVAHASTLTKVALAGLAIATVVAPIVMMTSGSTAEMPLPSLLNATKLSPLPPNTCPNFPINFDEIDPPVNFASNVTRIVELANETVSANVTQAAEFVNQTVFSNVTQTAQVVNETISSESIQEDNWDLGDLGSIAFQMGTFPIKALWETSKFISDKIATPLYSVTNQIPMPFRVMMKFAQGKMLYEYNQLLPIQKAARLEHILVRLEYLNHRNALHRYRLPD